MVVLGIGLGLFISSVTTAGVTALDPRQASLAGGSVGLGLVTAIFISTANGSIHAADVADRLTNAQEHALLGVLAGTGSAQQIMQQFPHMASELDIVVRQAFASAMQVSFRVVAIFGALGFLMSLFFVGGRLHPWHKAGTAGLARRLPPARLHHRAYHRGRIPQRRKR